MVVYQDSRIIETKAVSQTKSACLWCNFEARHCFGARCISEHHSLPISPSPLPSLCESRPHISQHRSSTASQRKSHPTSRRQPAPRTSPQGLPVRDPHDSIHRLSNTVRTNILPAPSSPNSPIRYGLYAKRCCMLSRCHVSTSSLFSTPLFCILFYGLYPLR